MYIDEPRRLSKYRDMADVISFCIRLQGQGWRHEYSKKAWLLDKTNKK